MQKSSGRVRPASAPAPTVELSLVFPLAAVSMRLKILIKME